MTNTDDPHDRARGGDGKFTRSLDTAERDAEAARMRSRGHTYQQIADQLGFSNKGTAYAAVHRAMAEVVAEPAAEAVQFELDRLDQMHQAALKVLEGHHVTVSNGKVVTLDDVPLQDDGPVLAAIDRLVRISESRRKLLGLDSPVKTQISGGLTYEVVGIDPAQLT
jgi:hypothetical protein